MKMICTYRCIVNGDIVKPGTILDVSKDLAEKQPFASSFKALETSSALPTSVGSGGGSDLPSGATGNVSDPLIVAGLTREQALAKLRQAGCHIPNNISTAKLVERYEEAFNTDMK